MNTTLPPLTKFQADVLAKEKRSNDGCCIFGYMGSGKTRLSIELTKKFKAKRILVVSLKKIVKDTWPDQLKRWQLNHTCISLVGVPGAKQQTILEEGIPENSVVVVNFEAFSRNVKLKNRPKRIDTANSPWLLALINIEWDVIIIDESTKIKDPTSNSSLALLNLSYNCPDAYVMCLTGTPNPEESLDFYTQISVVDRGKRFGPSFTAWRDKFFYQPKYSFDYIPLPFCTDGKTLSETISDLCNDLCHVLTKQDFLAQANLPDRKDVDIYFNMCPVNLSHYKNMKEFVLDLEQETITAVNAAVMLNKLKQISSGFIYGQGELTDTFNKVEHFFGHNKLKKLIDLVNSIDGKVIVCYNFKASFNIITLYLGLNNIEYADAKTTSEEEFKNSKTIKVLLLQPASGAYGSNYQHDCCNMIWYELQDSGEKFAQTECRIHRTGQTKECTFYYILGNNTFDKLSRDKVRAKETTALVLLHAIRDSATPKKDLPPSDDDNSDGLLAFLLDDMF